MTEQIKQKTIHGNFMIINQLGVLFTGDHDIGKSELTLALIDRGHTIVSDDAINIIPRHDELIASCPKLINHFLLINGIGVINVNKLFGKGRVAHRHPLQLIIHLVKQADMPNIDDPLYPLFDYQTFFNISIKKITFPALIGRSLPVCIETLIRNHQLRKAGYDAAQDFRTRQQTAIAEDTP